jgi:hypothetical protein
MRDRLASTALLLLAFAMVSCATVPKDQAEAEALMWDAARECKGRYATIQSVDRIDHYGRLHYSYQGSGHENNAFMQCYRDSVEQKARVAANIPQERVARDPDSPPRIAVPAEPTGGVALIVVRLNGTTDARMIVDTGAAWTILSPSIVSKLGLAIPINTRHSIAHVAGGREITMPRIRLASAKVASASTMPSPKRRKCTVCWASIFFGTSAFRSSRVDSG